jgi:hypothetical protein
VGTLQGIQGTSSFVVSSATNSLKSKTMNDERKISQLFHIKVISKHNKIDILFDSGLQINLIYQETVKTLRLETKPHPKP